MNRVNKLSTDRVGVICAFSSVEKSTGFSVFLLKENVGDGRGKYIAANGELC